MFKDLLKKLNLTWIKKKGIWDVVVYGSYARGDYFSRDIDIALILNKKISLNQKWQLNQEFKNKFGISGKKLDVKSVDLKDLLNVGFLGREAILAEGYSLINDDYLAERFGFEAIALLEYSLEKLSSSKKKTVYYALQGRSKGKGVLSKLHGRIISGGVLEVPTKHYEEISNLLKQHLVPYQTTFVLKYRIVH